MSTLIFNTLNTDFRTEHDSMRDVQVPAEKYWGAQTERSRNNIKIGPNASMPIKIIEAFVYLKKAAGYANIGMVDQMDAEGFGHCSNTEACEVDCLQEISVLHIGRMNYEYNRAQLVQH